MTDTRHYQWDLPAAEVSHEAGCPFQFLSLGLFGLLSGDVRLKCLSDILAAKTRSRSMSNKKSVNWVLVILQIWRGMVTEDGFKGSAFVRLLLFILRD